MTIVVASSEIVFKLSTTTTTTKGIERIESTKVVIITLLTMYAST
jgi:hypothetical protein